MGRHDGATQVVVVHAPACHLCDDAEQALALLAERFPLDVRVVELESERGRRLQAEHRPALSPLILVDGAFFSAGRLPRRKLEKLLSTRPVPGPAPAGAGR